MAKVNLTIKSEFFKLEEFTKSSTAERMKIDNTPTNEIISNLQYGVDMILDPLRRCFGKPIIITSGYRCAKLNAAVGGVANSWHLKGNAADIHVSNRTEAQAMFRILQKLPSVDTCLFEHSSKTQWLHVQWDLTKNPRHHFNFNYIAT